MLDANAIESARAIAIKTFTVLCFLLFEYVMALALNESEC